MPLSFSENWNRRSFLRTLGGALIGSAIPFEVPASRPIVRYAEWSISSVVPISDELLRSASINDVEAYVRGELARALVESFDRIADDMVCRG